MKSIIRVFAVLALMVFYFLLDLCDLDPEYHVDAEGNLFDINNPGNHYH